MLVWVEELRLGCVALLLVLTVGRVMDDVMCCRFECADCRLCNGWFFVQHIWCLLCMYKGFCCC